MAYEIGKFAILSPGEECPSGLLPIVLEPLTVPLLGAYMWFSPTTEAVLQRMPDIIKPGDRVLDFGCGAFAVLTLAAYALGAKEVLPCEINAEYRAEASRRLIGYGGYIAPYIDLFGTTNFDIMQDVMNTLEGRDASAPMFDVVLANVGDAHLVGQVSKYGTHGLGTDQEGTLIEW